MKRNLKSEDDIKNEDNIKNENDLKKKNDLKKEIVYRYSTPHEKYNVHGITHARVKRKDNIFMQRQLVQLIICGVSTCWRRVELGQPDIVPHNGVV